eukprot:jgi/Ulvmu1/7705/UM039_0011.1
MDVCRALQAPSMMRHVKFRQDRSGNLHPSCHRGTVITRAQPSDATLRTDIVVDSSRNYHAAVTPAEGWRMCTAVASCHDTMPANSTYTELNGMLVALEQFIRSKDPEELQLLEEVHISNDNQASIAQAKTNSGPHPAILRKMQGIAASNNFKLNFKWLPRTAELMEQADHLTRHDDPSDWLLDRSALTDTVMRVLDDDVHARILQTRWEDHPWPPDIDLFASEAAHQCPLYYSALWDRACIGMDAFRHNWAEWPAAMRRADGGLPDGSTAARGDLSAGGAGVLDGGPRKPARHGSDGPDAGRSRSRRSGVVMHAVAGVSGQARLSEIRTPQLSRKQPVCFAFPPPGDMRKVLRKVLRDRATVWLVHRTDLAVTDQMLLDSLPVLFSRPLGRGVADLVTPTHRNTIALEAGMQWTQDLQICLISWE